MKARKKCVLAGVLAALLLFTSCDTINAYLSGEQQTPQEPAEAQRAEDAKKATEEGGMKKIGDTVEYVSDLAGTKMAYTVQKVEIFNDYRDSGIPEEELEPQELNENPIVVIEVKAKKVSGKEKQKVNDEEDKFDEYSNIGDIRILNRGMLDEEKETGRAYMPEILYFSGHPSAEDDSIGQHYCKYWLDPGEEAVFQVAWQVEDPVFERGQKAIIFDNLDGGVYLRIGGSSSPPVGAYVDLEMNVEESKSE